MLPLLLVSLLGVGVQASFLPVCASTCVGEAIDATLCSSADTPCICASKTFLPSLNACIEFNCEDEEQQDAIARADQFCAAAQPHSGLRARDAEPEPAPAPVPEAEEERYGYGHHPRPPQYGGGKHYPPYHPPEYGGMKHHHEKCRHDKNPFWCPSEHKCLKKCKPHHYLKDKECHPKGKPYHHHKCQHSPHPYWHYESKKCVHKCPPHHYEKDKECHHHKPTYTPTTTHKHTKTTHTRYTHTPTHTAYY